MRSLLEAWFLPDPSAVSLSLLLSGLGLASVQLPLFILALITSVTCHPALPINAEPLLGLSHFVTPETGRALNACTKYLLP